MSDKAVLVLAAVVGIVLIAALVVFLYRGRSLQKIKVKVPGGELTATMGSEGSPSVGIVQRGVKAGRKVSALDETERGILQENVEAGDVEATAKPRAGGGTAKKKP